MNNTEIEMILQELLKDVQTIKLEIRQTSNLPNEENGSTVSSQLEAIRQEIATINCNIKIVVQKKTSDVPRIDYTTILRFEEKLKAFKQIQSLPPPDQIITHIHSFKNWQ